jgi:hypothetical protein
VAYLRHHPTYRILTNVRDAASNQFRQVELTVQSGWWKRLPVLRHDLDRPGRFGDRSLWCKSRHVWFEVEYR